MTQTPAGWYPNPDPDGTGQRYWSGSAWTEHYHQEEARRGDESATEATVASDPPGTLWSAVGRPLTGIGAGKYRLTNHYLFFEKGTLRTDSQQVPISAVLDVDVRQSMTQKARGVGTIVVHIQRPQRVELVHLEDIPNFREGQAAINDASHGARLAIQRSQNTMRYEGIAPLQAATAPAGAEANSLPASDPMDQLRKLGELRDAGVLSEEEFAAKKSDILARM